MKISNYKTYVIAEALELIINLLIENKNDTSLDDNIYTKYAEARVKYIKSTLKLLGEIKNEKD